MGDWRLAVGGDREVAMLRCARPGQARLGWAGDRTGRGTRRISMKGIHIFSFFFRNSTGMRKKGRGREQFSS